MVAQAGPGRIELFEDFFSGSKQGATVADNADETPIGPFRIFGQGADEADAGALSISATSGAVRLTTTDEADHAIFVGTNLGMSAEANGHLVLETRVQFNNLATKEAFIGFADVAGLAQTIEGGIAHGGTATLTLTASDICGFLLSAELTEDEMWHFIHNGGATTGVTDSTALESDVDAVAGEWDILRIEIDPNGTARWYINGVLKKTLAGAVAPSVVLAAMVGVEAKGAAIEEMDVDYLKVCLNRDWSR